MYKTSLVSGLFLVAVATTAWALPNPPAPIPTPAPALPAAALPGAPPADAGKYSANELDLLFKPVALYPDPLLAQMLPAASHPAQIEAANQFLKANPKGDVDSQPWDASVKALAHYPEVVEQMAQDLAWTEALGQAAAQQMGDVTASIQRLRTQAYAAGNLESNEQQTVNTDENYITIQPTSPQMLYVPVYNPYLVYAPRPYGWTGSLISFGLGYACGSWLTYGFDWYGSSCFRYPYGNYYGSYWGNPGCNRVTYVHNTYNLNNANCWRPTYGAYNTYNTCYRPGNSWSRVPGCNYSSGGNWTSSNFYRPGGNWSRNIGSGWNSPGSHPPSNWNSGGHWSNQSGYRPGGSWSTPGNSRYTGGSSHNNGWSNHHSGWSSGNTGSNWNDNRGSSWTSGNTGSNWNGNRGSSWSSGNTGSNWNGNRGSGWSGGNNGWSGNRGSSWSSGNHGGGFKMPSVGTWNGGGHRSGGFSMPSSGGRSGGFSMPSTGGWSGNRTGGFTGGRSGGFTGGRSGGWSGGGRGFRK
ncbi:MAG: DUF3300 domain-containing protein [Candidatus Eremiobacteraeota bacterium]|nr:DUF3300 domain-containing protein [Candidatus Eremiobacteraeota bacterium]